MSKLYGSVAFIVLGISLVLIGFLNYSGFCFKKLRYLSDQEKIQIAILAANSKTFWDDSMYNSELKITDQYRKNIPYESVSAFIKANPDCCTVDNTGFSESNDAAPSQWNRILGTYNFSVKVKFLYRYYQGPLGQKNRLESEAQLHKSMQTFWFTAGNCGDICCLD